MAHDDFEMAIERQLQGALDATETATLRQHVDGCASCRGYEAAARDQNERMETMFRQTTATVDLNRIAARVQTTMRAHRRMLWLLPSYIVLVAFGPLVTSVLRGDHGHLALRAAFPVLMAIGGFFVMRRASRHALSVAEWQLATKGGLTFYRELLDRQIKANRVLRWTPLIVVPFVALQLYQRSSDQYVLLGSVVAASLLLSYVAQFVRLPRALRERAELG